MTVSSTTNRVSYAGDGSTTAFSFPYYFIAQSDLLVTLTNITTGVITTQVITSDYTVSGTQAANGTYPSGGTVTFLTAPASGNDVAIVRKPADTQTTHWVDGSSDSALVKETAFDKLTLLMQRAFDLLSLVPTIPDGSVSAIPSAFSNQLPSVMTANYGLAVNASGNGWQLIPVAGATQGTVTSIGISMPGDFSVTSSPITASGTIAVAWLAQAKNLVFAGPSTGSNASPTWRSLVVADMPAGILASTLSSGAASSGYVLVADGLGGASWSSVAGTGTVTSVGLTVPGFMSVASSPITASGTIAVSMSSQSENLVLASPSGSSGTPTFRALTVADIPANYLATSLSSGAASSGKVLTADGSGASAWLTPGGLTSVALSLPSGLTVSGSPLTANGTISATWANQTQNTFFAGPLSGVATTPTWRAIGNADLPVMVGCTNIAAGVIGAVPAPTTGEQSLFLRGDGTWNAPTGGPSLGPQLVTVSGSVTLSAVAQTAVVAAASPCTVTLPAASALITANSGNDYASPVLVTNTTTNAVTIAAAGSDLIDGAATTVLQFQWSSVTLYPTASGWIIS